MTGVDKLRGEGYTGSGIRLAVIDSGIDYKHPALGGCFGKGCLVEYGWNLLTNTSDPWEGKAGHGTHVSGIIAAQPNPYGFTGVAPNVTLGHYKILGPQQVKYETDIVTAAFKMAYEDKSDIISGSFGTYKGWSDEPSGEIVRKLADAGIPTFISDGNDGSLGLFLASDRIDSPGSGIGIGSINNKYSPLLLSGATYSAQNGTKPFGWQLAGTSDFNNGTYTLYPSSLNASVVGDSCEPWTGDHPDLSDKVVLIRYGGCKSSLQQANAAKAGAKNVLMYLNEPGTFELPTVEPTLTGVGMVSAQTGEKWIKLAAAGVEINLNMISQKFAKTIFINETNPQSGGQISEFTQWGPSNELLPVTAVSAPGGFILSTWPVPAGSYAIESGTSMATPYTAACVALLMEARGKGKLTPAELRSLLTTTATPNVFHDGVTASPFLGSVAQQGGGLIDAYKLVHATTSFNVSTLAFNDTQHIAPAYIRISNNASSSRDYTVGHVGAATVYTLSGSSSVPVENKLGNFTDRTTEGASLQFSSSSISVPAGGSAVIKVTATPPKGLDSRRIPVYSGYVTFNGTSSDDSFSVPYLGVAAVMRNATILDTTEGSNILTDSVTEKPIKANEQLVFPGENDPADRANTSYPIFQTKLSMGTDLLLVGVKAVNNSTIFPVVDPEIAVARTTQIGISGPNKVSFMGQLANGSYVPEGNYTMVVRALKIFGNRKNPRDYETVRTVNFGFTYAPPAAQ
ncbi:unnamed protein product [Penicillium salamii]|uniref:Uncharacterized protein n=1 Tax=Penicillium salamii TaxID=1612424 RepID=A0A9W4J7M3_9EURO|nr:unnamed protein product [Penicillium salamii]CAG8097829.1 unnamed protein product [Penicillium salamii]CAG8139142.1 unnamed protein product [Penicillium salamii]CAG8193447.1 unnamed protein product [Penicillium salamii]CAG8296627.1 unnamed protein product [Penicillium salamii]